MKLPGFMTSRPPTPTPTTRGDTPRTPRGASRRLAFGSLTLACGIALSACAGFTMKTPSNFVELDEDNDSYELRATSAQGVVLSVREVDNDPYGTLYFWVEAINNRLRAARGYALLEQKNVRASTGEAGRQLRYGRDEGDKPYAYWLTIFVTHDSLYIIEAGGRREQFDRVKPQIEQAIARFEIN